MIARPRFFEAPSNAAKTSPYFYQTRSGGDADRITFAIGHASIADFTKPGKSTLKALRETYGDEVAVAVESAANKSIASEQDFMIQYRPDLSYVPSGQGK